MPFLRATLTELRQQALTDMMTAPGGDGMGVLRRAVSRAVAWALGNLSNGLHGHLDWVSKQSVPYSAGGEYLEAWASLVGVNRKAATSFTGTGQWTGVVGAPLPAGTLLSGPGGLAYVTTADGIVGSDGLVTAPISAQVPGIASTLDVGEALSITSGVAGVVGAGTLIARTAPGVDPRAGWTIQGRMLQRWAAPPQGGDAADYLEWALAVPGVTRAWVNPLGAGAGTVVVYSMWDVAEASHRGFPQGADGVAALETRDTVATGDQLVLANALYPLRPATALVYSVAPIAYPVAFTIHPKSAVSTTVRLAVQAAIDDVFLAVSSPLAVEIETDPFVTAIAAVPGMPDFTLTAPAAPITAPIGRLPVRGTVAYA